MEDYTYWEFYYGTDVMEKRCAHCNTPMRFDRSAAVRYKKDNEVYHWYCLLNKTTTYQCTHNCY
jgi:hypothetical protein